MKIFIQIEELWLLIIIRRHLHVCWCDIHAYDQLDPRNDLIDNLNCYGHKSVGER